MSSPTKPTPPRRTVNSPKPETASPSDEAEVPEEALKLALNRPVPLSDLLKAEAKKSAIAMESTHVGPREPEEPKTNSH